MGDAVKTQAPTDVRRFVDASPVWSNVGLLPGNGAGICAVGQSTFGNAFEKSSQVGKSGRKENHIEFFAQVRSGAHDRIRNVRIRNAGFFQGQSEPTFILRA